MRYLMKHPAKMSVQEFAEACAEHVQRYEQLDTPETRRAAAALRELVYEISDVGGMLLALEECYQMEEGKKGIEVINQMDEPQPKGSLSN